MGVLGIPVMSKQSFIITVQVISKCWWDLFSESGVRAGYSAE